MGKIRIAEMTEKLDIDDSNLIIVEDEIDTKRTTIKELKRAFTGQEPDEYKFYTSKKVSELMTNLDLSIGRAASQSDLDSLKQQFSNVISGANSDSEVKAARKTYATLNDRLEGDIKDAEKKFIQFPHIKFVSSTQSLDDFEKASITITAPSEKVATRIKIEGKNKFNYGENVWGAAGTSKVPEDKNAIKMTFTNVNAVFQIALINQIPAGEYTFYAKHTLSDDFVKEGTVFKIVHTDGSYTVIDNYHFFNSMRFNIGKAAKAIQIVPKATTIKNNMTLTLTDIMISTDYNLKRYYEYQDEYIAVAANTPKTVTKVLDRCVVSRVASTTDALTGTLTIEGTDTSYTGDRIKEQFDELYDTVYSTEDKCGLITNKGQYIYAANCIINDTESQCSLDLDYTKQRNGVPSVNIRLKEFTEYEHPRFTMVMNNPLNLSDARYISIQMYIGSDLFKILDEDEAIRVMISSDAAIDSEPTHGNKKFFNIGGKSLVQGWNTVKLLLKDFAGNSQVTMSNITQINFRVNREGPGAKADYKNFYLNAVIIDQMIKPTLMFAFNDFDVNGFSYTYKELERRGIPATIFANDKQTLNNEFMSNMAQFHYNLGWDLGLYGCNPNKDIMIGDSNSWEQYLALKNSRSWFYEVFTDSVISYAAPYDNLRPITEPILREMGFKIAKEDADQYISFFTKEDLVVPTRLLSNADGCGSDIFKKRIDEIVDTGQAMCICTDGVSVYGSDTSATRASFEEVLDYAVAYRDRGLLDIMTFREFYKQCAI